MEDKKTSNKLLMPISIILGSIIVGGFYYATLVNKQKLIEVPQNNTTEVEEKIPTNSKVSFLGLYEGSGLVRSCPSFDCKVIKYGAICPSTEVLYKENDWYKVKFTEMGVYDDTIIKSTCGDGGEDGHGRLLPQSAWSTDEGWMPAQVIPPDIRQKFDTAIEEGIPPKIEPKVNILQENTPTCIASFSPKVVETGGRVDLTIKATGVINDLHVSGTGALQYLTSHVVGTGASQSITYDNGYPWGNDSSYYFNYIKSLNNGVKSDYFLVLDNYVGESSITFTVIGSGGSNTCTASFTSTSNKLLQDTRNAQRRSDVLTILNSIYQYSIDNNGNIPSDIITSPNCTSSGTDAINLRNELVGDNSIYLNAIPTDPLSGIPNISSNYFVTKNQENQRITVCAPSSENVGISVTR